MPRVARCIHPRPDSVRSGVTDSAWCSISAVSARRGSVTACSRHGSGVRLRMCALEFVLGCPTRSALHLYRFERKCETALHNTRCVVQP